MGPYKPIAMALSAELALLDLADWRQQIGQALSDESRLVSLFGRLEGAANSAMNCAPGSSPDGRQAVLTTAVLQRGDGALSLLRGRGPRAASYPALTPQFPAAQLFERELWEQTGLTPDGHPWLKPVRYQGALQQRMGEYPFFKVRGQEVHEVGVGPIHASVIEPGHFRFMCHGEQVHHLEIQLGYQHRDVESLLLQRPALSLSSLVESIAGDTSIAYAWGYCAAVEALSGTQVSESAELVRGVALEMERVAMHLVALTGLATDIAFLQGGASFGRLRTAIINATMRVCGSRLGRGWLRPGGVRHTLTAALRQDLLDTLSAYAKDMAEVNALMLGARSVQSRFQGVGVVDRQAALDIGMVGLAARASGVAIDARASLPGRLYTAHPVSVLTEDGGDCWARMKLRMREIDESLRWLRSMLEGPLAGSSADSAGVAGDPAERPPAPALGPLWPDTLCVSVREGFRGPVVQALETGPDGKLLHYKVQDPSLLNWFGLALAVRNNEISDFPICNKSFDLSYCGNDL